MGAVLQFTRKPVVDEEALHAYNMRMTVIWDTAGVKEAIHREIDENCGRNNITGLSVYRYGSRGMFIDSKAVLSEY